MNDLTKRVLRLQAKKDQIMEELKDLIPYISKIKKDGPSETKVDKQLCQILASITLSEYAIRSVEIKIPPLDNE